MSIKNELHIAHVSEIPSVDNLMIKNELHLAHVSEIQPVNDLMIKKESGLDTRNDDLLEFEIDKQLKPTVRNAADSSMSTSNLSKNRAWEIRFVELLQWREKHGDTCVPKAEGALGRWVARQRELKRIGSK